MHKIHFCQQGVRKSILRPNPRMQPTASRARSLAFQRYLMRALAAADAHSGRRRENTIAQLGCARLSGAACETCAHHAQSQRPTGRRMPRSGTGWPHAARARRSRMPRVKCGAGMPQPRRIPARRPTIALQRTRFAPRDRGDVRNRCRADGHLARDRAPLNSTVGPILITLRLK